jgi:hypothetical protein
MVGLAFKGADFEGNVKRAEGNDGSQQEDRAEYNQDNTEHGCDDTAKIQISKQGSDDDTDNAVKVGHIAFHRKISFWVELDCIYTFIVGDLPQVVCDNVT